MKAFIPIDITDDILVSSTISEPSETEPLWSSTKTYAEDELVSVIETNSHLVYTAKRTNLNKPPATSKDDWFLKGKTNRFRMFDWNQRDPSVGSSEDMIIIRPKQRINSLMVELQADYIDITVTDGSCNNVIYQMSKSLLKRNVSTFYEWFYVPFVYEKKIVVFDIQPVSDPIIKLTVRSNDGSNEILRLPIGFSIDLGVTQFSPVLDMDNYSKVVRDGFASATFYPAQSIPKNEYKIVSNRNRVNVLRKFREDVGSKAAVWSALDDMDYEYTESLIIFGFVRDFNIEIPHNEYTLTSLYIEGI